MIFHIIGIFTIFLVFRNLNGQTFPPVNESFPNGTIPLSEEKKLIQYLLNVLKITGKHGRPVMDYNQPNIVKFGLGLIQLTLDEKTKVLVTSMWSQIKWKDFYLRWDPYKFGNVTNVRLNPSLVWLPDIMLINSADPREAAFHPHLVVKYTGDIIWIPHQVFKSSCSIDVTNFPFDQQKCYMLFGSWTHTRSDVDIELAFPAGIDIHVLQGDYKNSSEWDIINSTAEISYTPNNSSSGYSVVTFTIIVKRRVMFSTYILTLPCVFLALLTLLVFWLPPDRPDRTALAMSLFSSFLVLLLILVEAAPPTASSVPILGLYYCCNMVIIMVAICLSTLVVNVSRCGGSSNRTVPKWLRFIFFRIIAKLIFIDSCHKRCRRSSNYFRSKLVRNHHHHHHHHNKNDGTISNSYEFSNFPLKQNVNVNSFKDADDLSEIDGGLSYVKHLEGQMMELKSILCEIYRSICEREEERFEQMDSWWQWKTMARILDRLFFLIYVITIAVSLITLFPRSASGQVFK